MSFKFSDYAGSANENTYLMLWVPKEFYRIIESHMRKMIIDLRA